MIDLFLIDSTQVNFETEMSVHHLHSQFAFSTYGKMMTMNCLMENIFAVIYVYVNMTGHDINK